MVAVTVSRLTEIEIFSKMSEEFRLAAEECDQLSKLPAGSILACGPIYNSLRHRLKLVEGCMRQAAYFREDSRWLPVGVKIEGLHQMIGNWLRQKIKPSPRVFELAAANMRALYKVSEMFRHQATGVRGPILPHMPTPLIRPDRSVTVPRNAALVLH